MAIKRKGVKLTARQQAAYIREITGWSKTEYQKEYDKLRNRVRNYEKVAQPTQKLNVADLLARHVREQYYATRFGDKPRDTALWDAIQKASSASTGKTPSAKTVAKISAAQKTYVDTRFHGVINNSKYAADIRRDVAALEKQLKRPITSSEYEAIVVGYARKLDEERQAVAKHNRDLKDPLDAAFFHST